MNLTGKQAAFLASISTVIAMANIVAVPLGVGPAYEIHASLFARVGQSIDPKDLFPLLDHAWQVLMDESTDFGDIDPEKIAQFRAEAKEASAALNTLRQRYAPDGEVAEG